MIRNKAATKEAKDPTKLLAEQQEANEYLEFDEELRHAANGNKAKEAKGAADHEEFD